MFKKDDKVKVIKGIKAFEGLTGTVLDTNGSQVKVKLNMSEDAEVQKNIINIFEDYQLELESLDLLKEEAEVAFDNDEEYNEDELEPTEEAKKELAKYEQMVQDATKNGKPIELGRLKVYFKNRPESNPEIRYETGVFYRNDYPSGWDTPDWDLYDEVSYTLSMDFDDFIYAINEVQDPFDCLREANIYEYPEDANLKPRDILYIIAHLDSEIFDYLNEKAQNEYDGKNESLDYLKEDYTTNAEAAEQAIKLYRTEPNIEGVFFGVDTKDGFVSYVKAYHNDTELQEINNQIEKAFPNHGTVWAAHSDYAINEIERQLKNKLNKKSESLKLTEEQLKAWCSDNDANYYTQDIKDDKVIIRGLKEDLAEYDFKTKELKVFDYSGTTTQEQDLEDEYDDNYIRDYVYDVDILDDKEYPSWEFVSVIAIAENISDDSVIEEAHNRGFKVFLIQASNYEKFVVAAEKITEDDIMEDFASYLEGNPKVTEIV